MFTIDTFNPGSPLGEKSGLARRCSCSADFCNPCTNNQALRSIFASSCGSRARTVWDQLEGKQRPVHRRLLLSIYAAMAKDMSLLLVERTDAQRHYEQLARELEGVPHDDLLRM